MEKTKEARQREETVRQEIAAMNPQPGDILLFSHPQGVGRLIALVTRSRFYHVGLYAGNAKVMESRPRGVVCRSLMADEGGHLFLTIPAPANAGRAALDWANRQIGEAYDRKAIAVILLEHIFVHWRINYTSRNQFTCGEFVARAYQNAGVTLFPQKSPDVIVPADFAALPAKTANVSE